MPRPLLYVGARLRGRFRAGHARPLRRRGGLHIRPEGQRRRRLPGSSGTPTPTVGADSISAREACHCRRRPRATNGRPYIRNKAGMQFFDSPNRRTPRGIPHTSICGAAGKKKGAARRRLRKVNVQMRAETEPTLFVNMQLSAVLINKTLNIIVVFWIIKCFLNFIRCIIVRLLL